MFDGRRAGGWVVYRVTVHRRGGDVPEANAVCEQAEWEALQRNAPGRHTLVRAGVASEPEAERLAREAPGGTAVATAPRLKAR